MATALDEEARRTGKSNSTVVSAALAQYLGVSLHSLLQISTSGSLVTGVYSGAISVKELLSHGDFGLGVFDNLDGEMVVVVGAQFRMQKSLRKATEPRCIVKKQGMRYVSSFYKQ